MKKITYNELFEHHAGFMLCEVLPKGWGRLSRSEVEDVLKASATYANREETGSQLYAEIASSTSATIRFLREYGIEVGRGPNPA